jgi:FIMAH domain
MITMKSGSLLIILAVLVGGAGLEAAESALNLSDATILTGSYGDDSIGWQFKPLKMLEVTSLGYYNVTSALGNPVTITIYRESDGTPLGTATVPAGSHPSGYVYKPVVPAAPGDSVLLDPAETYVIASFDTGPYTNLAVRSAVGYTAAPGCIEVLETDLRSDDQVMPSDPGSNGSMFLGASFQFEVVEDDPAAMILALVDTVEEMNLHQGIDNSLDAKLGSALNALDDLNENNDVAAVNSLQAFINAVEAQRGKKLTDDQADILVADAQAIIDLLTP